MNIKIEKEHIDYIMAHLEPSEQHQLEVYINLYLGEGIKKDYEDWVRENEGDNGDY